MAYNPDLHIVSNKPYATAQAEPIDARAYFYDAALFKYRAYQSTAEVISYLNAPEYRTGQFSIIINLTGTLQLNGTYTDTHITEWWFKDGVADINLVPKCSDCFNENGLTRFGIEDNLGLQDRAVDMQIQDLIITNMGTGQFAAGDVTYAGRESELYITPGFSNLYSQLDGNINSSVNVDSGQSYIVSYDGSSFETLTVSATHITLDDNTNSWNNSDPTKFITTDSSGNLVLTSVPAAPTYTFADSIVNTAGTVTFVNDVLSPPASYYYGTNVSGTKGWFILPSPGANRVEPLQETCDVGHTTTTSIIIGSSNTAHSGVAGQLVVGTSSAATSAATNGVALNSSTVSGVNSVAINAGNATGATALAANTSTASGANSAAFGSGCGAAGAQSAAFGTSNSANGVNSFSTGTGNGCFTAQSFSAGNGNTVNGVNGACFGQQNILNGESSVSFGFQNLVSGQPQGNESKYSLIAGRNNTTVAGSSAYCESNVMLGISNTSSAFARGSVALGGANTVGCDFSVAAGTFNTTLAKASVAMGYYARTLTHGEVALASCPPSYLNKSTNTVGMCQTSIITMVNHDETIGNNHTLSTKACVDAAGNEQACTANDVNPFGIYYYQVDDNTVHYIQGRLIGITSTGDICVWTIDTYFKNVAGVVTSGTTAFTNVLRETAFTNMNTASLTFTTTTGNLKSLKVTYTNTSTYPVAEYSCTLTINKLTWKA